jgi:hypothetical protein
MDIDTLTLVSLYYYDNSDLISWGAVAESCREEPMYRRT